MHYKNTIIGLEEASLTDTQELIYSIQEFLGLEMDESIMKEVAVDNMETDDYQSPTTRLNDMYKQGALLMSLVQATASDDNILRTLDDVLLDEMKISKNLTAWPCESFWTVGEPDDRLTISPVVSRISKAMSPNCSAPFTSCVVKRDKCEYEGDGTCK
jgi:hypothetical protein